jgi:glycosyltransferase involved in cell wall biosynthesis
VKDCISVIIPAYNSSQFLADAIHSVRAQEWPGLEIIVVDDGSCDDTPRVITELMGDDLTALRQVNEGPASARNRGIRCSRGDWIAFLDADDRWLPGKLESQMKALASAGVPVFSYTDAVCRSAMGVERPRLTRSTHGHLFLDLLLGPQFGTGSVIVRRDCLDAVGYFNPGLRTGEDWDMWLRLAARFPGCHVPAVLCLYRESDRQDKYPLELLEKCTMSVVEDIFSGQSIAEQWPMVVSSRRRIRSWHYSVLAKSYLKQRAFRSFFRLALASVLSHPVGSLYITKRWGRDGAFPLLVPVAARKM